MTDSFPDTITQKFLIWEMCISWKRPNECFVLPVLVLCKAEWNARGIMPSVSGTLTCLPE